MTATKSYTEFMEEKGVSMMEGRRKQKSLTDKVEDKIIKSMKQDPENFRDMLSDWDREYWDNLSRLVKQDIRKKAGMA